MGVGGRAYYPHPMATELSFGARLARAFRNLIIFSLIVGCAGAAVYAMSLVNSRTYSLEVRGTQLLVMKGKMLPTGAEPWLPSEPSLADAYAPIELDPTAPVSAVTNRRFDDRDQLDRAMFTVLEAQARPRLESSDAKELDRGLALVRRGERLSGLTDDQRASLKKMQSDVAYFLARVRLDDARKQLEEALAQLKIAAESDSKSKSQAALMLLAVEPQVKLLSSTLRATTLTAGDGLTKALEPQLQKIFDSLNKAVQETPAPAPAPEVSP